MFHRNLSNSPLKRGKNFDLNLDFLILNVLIVKHEKDTVLIYIKIDLASFFIRKSIVGKE